MTGQKKKIETFSYLAPEARSVMLTGDFTDWEQNPVPLKKQKSGTWKTTVSLEPGTHEYRFLVDGEWSDDPGCLMRVKNPFGAENCVRTVEQAVVLSLRPRPKTRLTGNKR
ncbi:MAG: isoamylase early set domain-containing protein [Verrucomicrobiota bacterium]